MPRHNNSFSTNVKSLQQRPTSLILSLAPISPLFPFLSSTSFFFSSFLSSFFFFSFISLFDFSSTKSSFSFSHFSFFSFTFFIYIILFFSFSFSFFFFSSSSFLLILICFIFSLPPTFTSSDVLSNTIPHSSTTPFLFPSSPSSLSNRGIF